MMNYIATSADTQSLHGVKLMIRTDVLQEASTWNVKIHITTTTLLHIFHIYNTHTLHHHKLQVTNFSSIRYAIQAKELA